MTTARIRILAGAAIAAAALAAAPAAADVVTDWNQVAIQATAIPPNAMLQARVLQWLALCFAAQGRFDDAVATSRRAAEADPLSPIIATDVGRHLYYARRYPAAIEQLRAAVELDPTFARAHQELGRAYRQYGLADLAVAELTRAVAFSDRASAPLAELASARSEGRASVAWQERRFRSSRTSGDLRSTPNRQGQSGTEEAPGPRRSSKPRLGGSRRP